ncbi:N-acetyltransferase family protein [Haloparvum sp. PAK95]|uniref:GNAT family N-acetyltransferase n=1 Tax=Haloparvum sp. PAK95 TaxID=3418962 RepID=UPI003D2EFEE5
MEIRAYDPDDADGLWACKRAFELGLGTGTGGEEKAEKYEGKLTESYRAEWFDWVDRCTDEDPRCITVAVDETGEAEGDENDDEVVGYVFVLPESMGFIWDSAVLNEIYVDPDYRGEGVGDDLMDAALEVAADQDLPLDRIVLDVDPENARAKAFYDRYGFEHWGELVAREL